MSAIADRLAELGVTLPDVPLLPLKANRSILVARDDGLAFVSGVGPIGVTGIVGGDMTTEAGYAAARTAGLYCLRRLADVLGDLDVIERWVKVVGFVRSAPGYGHQPEVLNGFSDLIVEVFGSRGRCARSAIGTSELPLNMPVEVEAIIAIRRDLLGLGATGSLET